MKAIPIIPGKLYRVSYNGRSVEVPATKAAEAIAIVLEGFV